MNHGPFCMLLGLVISAQAMAGGRLAGTGGVSQVEGAGGGGLVPWALIAGSGTRDEVSPVVFYTRVNLPRFTLNSRGVALGIHNRMEVSLAEQTFYAGELIPHAFFRQDIVGLKWRIAGDALIDQDKYWPQLAVGFLYKKGRHDLQIAQALGADRTADSELYLAATRIWLDGVLGRTTLLNGTLRYTRANQFGLLGFGGDRESSRQLCLEGSVALFVHDQWLVGAEYRQKPDNLAAAGEDAATDLFIAWLPSKQVSLTIAWARLGSIANQDAQNGGYASLQLSY